MFSVLLRNWYNLQRHWAKALSSARQRHGAALWGGMSWEMRLCPQPLSHSGHGQGWWYRGPGWPLALWGGEPGQRKQGEGILAPLRAAGSCRALSCVSMCKSQPAVSVWWKEQKIQIGFGFGFRLVGLHDVTAQLAVLVLLIPAWLFKLQSSCSSATLTRHLPTWPRQTFRLAWKSQSAM